MIENIPSNCHRVIRAYLQFSTEPRGRGGRGVGAAIELSGWKHAKLLDFIQLSGEMLEITKLVKQTERKKMRKREGERQREEKGAKIWHFWEFVCSFWTFTNCDFFGRQRRKSLNADVLVKLSVISISPSRLRIRNLLREFLFLGTLQLKIKKNNIVDFSLIFNAEHSQLESREAKGDLWLLEF